jgi:site-specific DNA-adenine methylase
MQTEVMRLPYQGSKQALVKKIYKAINEDIGNVNNLFTEQKINTIYDLFTGGGSVGYYFYNQGWQVYMNDIQEPLIELHKVLNMQDSPLTTNLLYKWISREEYSELRKKQDWYGELIRICWSFGNAGRSYLFGKNIEEYKKQLHFVVVNKSLDAGKKFLEMIGKQDDWYNFSKIYDIKEQKQRRLFIRTYVNAGMKQRLEQLERLQSLEQLQQLESLQRLESLQQLQRLERLEKNNITFICKNYWEVEFKENSVIYCDSPYLNTTQYNKMTFDFDKFDNWVREMKNKNIRVYISEYTNHNNEWRKVASFDKYSLMSNYLKTKTLKQENIFCNI